MQRGKIGLLLGAAAAAYGAYRLYKMTPEQRNNLKTRGRDFAEKNLGLSRFLSKKTAAANGH
jgi:hypothetical protein